MTNAEHPQDAGPSRNEQQLQRLDRLFEELQEALCHVYSEQLEFTLTLMDRFRQNVVATLESKDREVQRLLAIDPEQLSLTPQPVLPTGGRSRKQTVPNESSPDSENSASEQKALWQDEAAVSDDRATPES